ncbi:alpha-L-rhamnosidase [Microlunatus endophyticus]|uniref:alpha-L-rhamnosidase n=1 Tax=Microlunatus endophyticus TaxID=1716077 RepID=A0A917S7A6_9ACTN|nr:family 78 glycoside hydrolase catalytic domain [Microlunatus endophyticus]GGL59565.1 alpha-L-rhamnosidase [Microlunatus endophyticus]
MAEVAADPLVGATVIAADDEYGTAPLLRKEFDLAADHGDLVSATLTATALGVVDLEISGQPIAPDVLTPGWSSYEWRIRYRSYDVTALLPAAGGKAAIGASLGNGWYRGRIGFTGGIALYGDELGLVARLDLTYADDHVQTIVTDDSWKSGPSTTTDNQIYDGQTIDARRAQPGWSCPGFDDNSWTGVRALDFDPGRLTAPIGPPVIRHESIKPVAILTSPSGKTLIDFGQNLVGWLRFTVSGQPGDEIVITHAEVLENGELGTRPLRTAKQTDRFILSGGEDFFEPTKTFHGFRYVEVTGWPGELTPDSLEAVVVSSDLRRIGTFECSDELVNQLHRNVIWGQRGNFLDVPTDCPQRDERLGWTGDIAAFAPTAAYNFDVKDFLADWLRDLAEEQLHAGGRVPFVAPDVLKLRPREGEIEHNQPVTALWGDAAVWVPWTLYEAYGDQQILTDQYESMVEHARAIERSLSDNGLWDTGFQFADWLDPDAPPEAAGDAKADKGVVATACAYRTAVLVAWTAELLGHPADHDHFAKLADDLKAAFNKEYVDDHGIITSDCATVYALAIHFDLIDEAKREFAGNRLAELAEKAGYRVSTGFAGTPFVCWALSETGHLDTAYKLLLEKENPSWLYPVTMGATTIWERWDSMLPDGSINPGEMTSFNHYALGAVADWLHKVVVGIDAAEPGYSRIRIAPQPGGGLTSASGTICTPHGEVRSSWTVDGGEFALDVTVPNDCSAEVVLPGQPAETVSSGHHHFTAQLT